MSKILIKTILLASLLPCFARAELSINDVVIDDGDTSRTNIVRPAPERAAQQQRQAVPLSYSTEEPQQSGLLINGRPVGDDEPITVRPEHAPQPRKAARQPAMQAATEQMTEQEAASLPEIPIELDNVDESENTRVQRSIDYAQKITGIIDYKNPKDMEKVEAMKRYQYQKDDLLWLASQDPAVVWTVGIIWVLVLLFVFVGFLYIFSRKRYAPLEQTAPYQPPELFNRTGHAAPPPVAGQQPPMPIHRAANGRPQPNPQRLMPRHRN